MADVDENAMEPPKIQILSPEVVNRIAAGIRYSPFGGVKISWLNPLLICLNNQAKLFKGLRML